MPTRIMLLDAAEHMGEEDLLVSLDDADYDEQWDEFFDQLVAWRLTSGRKVLTHRLCGWPCPVIQNDPRFAAVMSARGLSFRLWRKMKDAQKAELEAEIHEWVLLLQIDLEELLGQPYGDGGYVYFVMREADLRERNFDRVHAIYQQH